MVDWTIPSSGDIVTVTNSFYGRVGRATAKPTIEAILVGFAIALPTLQNYKTALLIYHILCFSIYDIQPEESVYGR
jgi:hypothetical protein